MDTDYGKSHRLLLPDRRLWVPSRRLFLPPRGERGTVVARCPCWPRRCAWADPLTSATNWTQYALSGSQTFSFGGSGATITASVTFQECLYFSQPACTQHQIAQVTVSAISNVAGHNNTLAFVLVRGNGSNTFYSGAVQWTGSAWSFRIDRMKSGSNTLLTSTSGSFTAGDTIKIEATTPAGGVTTLNLSHNGTQVLTTTDNASGMTGTAIGVCAESAAAYSATITLASFLANTNS
jgi:hypothetical protein